MNNTLIIDLAKDVFEIGIANAAGKIIERKRLTRPAFTHFMATTAPSNVVMEACGSAHHWARRFQSAGHRFTLLPPQYVRPYRRRNKTDRADVTAILDASRSADIKPVPVKSVDQQNLQFCHRLREQWKATRTARINTLRAVLREHGHFFALGPATFLAQVRAVIDAEPEIQFLAPLLHTLLADIDHCAAQMKQTEQLLKVAEKQNPDIATLQSIPGIGLMISTGLVAAIGNPNTFRNGRQMANWLGITPRERSSGDTRRLGRITHQGNVYLRMLLIHGARSVLAAAERTRARTLDQLTPLQQWVTQLRDRVGFNKAAVALANKLARIAWAVWRHQQPFGANHQLACAVPIC